ncbi:MAG: sensor histidine kinase, partial [Planctomycetaceae bacterium]
GTLHIERKDGQPPSPNEISSLEVVAAQLAMAFDQSRRRWMLERALEEIPSEFRLIARDGRVIYRNRAAMVADHSKSSGWNGPLTVAPGTRPPLPDGCSRAMRLTLEQNAAEHLHAFSRFHLDNLNKGDASPGSRQWAETVAPLEDFRSQLRSPLKADGWVGVVQQVTDLTAFVELSHLVRNTLVVTNLAETCERILNFFRQRGHRWARIYLCDESKDQQLTLRSKAEFGISDPVVAERFRNGGFTITQADHNDVVWFLFQGEPRPVIFEHDETAQSGPTLFSEYPGSLKSYRVRDLWRQEFQKTDARWLEVPLFHGHVKVGLLALDIPNRFTAFEHETLSWACNCISSALYSAQQALAYSRVAEGQGVLDGAKAAAAMATHQLANLFGPIESACLYIQQDLAQMPSGSPQRESLRFNARLIEKEVVRAMEILRDFGRYVSDKPLPDVHGTRLEPVLNSIVADLRHYWQDIGFDLHVPERPSGVEPLSVIVSRSGLQEVFGILAANADRHGRRQPTQSLKVDIHLEFTTKGVRIRFRDNGVGVTSADRSRIFTPFFTTHSQGTGLGLAIAVNLMRRMNGSLTIADNAEGGACFCLELTAATHTGLNPITGEEHA